MDGLRFFFRSLSFAYELESGVAAFNRSDAKTTSIRHVPEARPDGCARAYTVQFTEENGRVMVTAVR